MMLLSSYLSFVLFVSENDSAFGQVVGTHLYLHLVARQDFNIVHSHLARDMCNDLHTILQFNSEHCIRQALNNGPVLLNRGLLCNN